MNNKDLFHLILVEQQSLLLDCVIKKQLLTGWVAKPSPGLR